MIAAGFHARAVLICQDTGSYCDAKNVKALNVIRDEGADEDDALAQLHSEIGDCAYRLREDGNEILEEGDTPFEFELGHQWRDAAANLDILVAEIEGVIRARLQANLAASKFMTPVGQVIAAQLAEAA